MKERIATLKNMRREIYQELYDYRQKRILEVTEAGLDPEQIPEDKTIHDLKRESTVIYTTIENLEEMLE